MRGLGRQPHDLRKKTQFQSRLRSSLRLKRVILRPAGVFLPSGAHIRECAKPCRHHSAGSAPSALGRRGFLRGGTSSLCRLNPSQSQAAKRPALRLLFFRKSWGFAPNPARGFCPLTPPGTKSLDPSLASRVLLHLFYSPATLSAFTRTLGLPMGEPSNSRLSPTSSTSASSW